MKEIDFNIDEVFDTKKSINEKSKRSNKKSIKPINRGKLFILLGLLVLFGVITICIIIFFKKDNEINNKSNLVYDEFDALISKLDDNTYYIFGAKNDISFEIEKGDKFSYKVLDKDNNEITVNSINNDKTITIKAPNNLYEEGKTYRLQINNGSFKDSKFKNGKQIIFNISRPTSNTYKLKENIHKVKESDVKISNNILTTNNSFQENDIVIIMDNNKLKSAYKITKVDGKDYKVESPKITDIFKEIDYYGMEKINLSNFTTNEELKSYLIMTVKRSILDSLIDTVYAKSNVEIKNPVWNNKNKTLTFGVIIETDENSKIFNNDFLKNHKSSINIAISVSANLYKNITQDNYDYALELEYTFNQKVNLTSINNNLNTLNTNIKNNKTDYDATWLIDDYKKINSDKVDIDKSLGSIKLESEVPGLYVLLDMGFIINGEAKTILSSDLHGTTKITFGINSNKEVYGSYNSTANGSGSMLGDTEIKVGYGSKANLNFLDIVTIDGNIKALSYTHGKSSIEKLDDNKEKKTITYEVKEDTEMHGIFEINANINNEKINKKIYDNKEKINTYEKKMEFIINNKVKEEEIKYKYSADEVRKILKDSYNALGESEEWSINGGSFLTGFTSNKTIDVDNNKFNTTVTYDNSISYTCSYNYIDKTMNCSNYEEAQKYVKNVCDAFHDDYLTYLETGECENEDAADWESIYDSIESCYYEVIGKNKPTDYKEDFDKIMNKAGLTEKDLEVLK